MHISFAVFKVKKKTLKSKLEFPGVPLFFFENKSDF